MKVSFLITLLLPTNTFANANELIDIKPIYSDFNYALLAPLIGLLLLTLVYLIGKIVIIIKRKYQSDKTVVINWSSLCDQVLNDSSLTPKQLEFELIHIIKSILEHRLSLKVVAKNDDEVLNYLLNDKREEIRDLDLGLKKRVQKFFKDSSQIRFSSKELSLSFVEKRAVEAKSICQLVEEVYAGRKR